MGLYKINIKPSVGRDIRGLPINLLKEFSRQLKVSDANHFLLAL